MRRRDFLLGGACLTTLTGCGMSLEQGVFNCCRPTAPIDKETAELVRAAWDGLHADRVWDTHTHLFGNGLGETGVWENPTKSLKTRIQRVLYVNASCGGGDNAGLDAGMVTRLAHLASELKDGAKVMVLAFDDTYDAATHKKIDGQTVFSVSNEYAARKASENKKRFEWIASIHPYRTDALDELAKAKANGARAVKWLPSVMGIDFRNEQTRRFFEEMKRLDMPLLTHVGEERALDGAGRHEFNNPLLLRIPLGLGVRVIGAHCASLGESDDLDANFNPKGGKKEDFELFSQLMGDHQYDDLLFGDLSAVTQSNRVKNLSRIIIEKGDWHHRLLNGSDYPLPGVMPIFSLSAYVKADFLKEGEAKLLRELRQANSLLFDFVLKRTIQHQGKKLPNAAFETRSFFDRSA
ncbi:amidohydrolase family protein [Usitatibacter palustris]|uniref:Amidohydrolase-related domain-containing protein n=1 Tax=Usitatibacter palustris TaxID=2732487 RepID=A0A6M4H6S4_9PROT|nr:amidohydrolase family protein [Usitatibacter palustris]QJR14648.1 hypothetical protein DSM104440_01458 [Usitatibacter palustris]